MAEHVLDCRNLNCPMPIVKVSKSIKTMNIGDTLEISATDPAFKADIEAWIRKTGNELVKFTDGQTKIALIKKITL
jgi:TusA-related sulfurtransferase